jgi:hypothetical protein
MQGSELKAIREAKGWKAWEMASALGYRGNRNANATRIYQLEARKTLPKVVEYRLAWANLRSG